MNTSRTRKLVYLGLMVGIAIALHIIESLLPIPAPVPGAKLGLANIATLYVIIRMGTKEAVCVTALRTTLGALYGAGLFAPTSLLSFSGGLISTLVMGICYRFFAKQFSIIGLSVLGAVTHNVAQLAAASIMFEQIRYFYYLPYLLFYALPTGFFVGIVTQQLARKIVF